MIKLISDKLNVVLKKSIAPLSVSGIKRTETVTLNEKKNKYYSHLIICKSYPIYISSN